MGVKCFFLMLGILISCRASSAGEGQGFNLYTVSQEQAWGERIHQSIAAEGILMENAALQRYLEAVVERSRGARDPGFPIRVHIVKSHEVNAFAIPGGHLYVCLGLLHHAKNEAQLAGVLAHEIGHIRLRHGSRHASKQEVFHFASLGMFFVSGPVGAGLRTFSSFASPAAMMKMSRKAEEEADADAVSALAERGYDPLEYITLFDSLKERKSGWFAHLYASHPGSAKRSAFLRKQVSRLRMPEALLTDTSEFAIAQQHVLSLLGSVVADDKPVLLRVAKSFEQVSTVEAPPPVRVTRQTMPGSFRDLRSEFNKVERR